MNDVLVILASGFEEAEAVITIDVLRRLGIRVCIASLGENLQVSSCRNVKIVADRKLSECKDEKFSAIVLPGGMPGAMNLKDSPVVIELIKKAAAEGACVCAICAAPMVLAQAGLLNNVEFTAYPGMDEYYGATPLDDMVVQDGNIITGKGPGAAFAFARKIAEALGKDSTQVAQGMFIE